MIILAGHAHGRDPSACENTFPAFLGSLVVMALVLPAWTPMRQLLPGPEMLTDLGAAAGFALGYASP